MHEPVIILVGTMTGTAELVAQEIAQSIDKAGYSAAVVLMDNLDSSIFQRGSIFLVVSSTYGNGDVPDNAQAFYTDLQSKKPPLLGVIYGIISLGDTTYKATFCNGGLKFDEILASLGARRAGLPLLHDASSGVIAEDAACEWIDFWLKDQLAPALAA